MYTSILEAVDADYVVQLGVVSAISGRACQSMGLPWLGLCANSVHASWARSCLDRWACEVIAQKGSPFHDRDLAELINTHLSDVLQQTKDRDEAKADDDDEQDDGAKKS